jgi:hypothetical protein
MAAANKKQQPPPQQQSWWPSSWFGATPPAKVIHRDSSNPASPAASDDALMDAARGHFSEFLQQMLAFAESIEYDGVLPKGKDPHRAEDWVWTLSFGRYKKLDDKKLPPLLFLAFLRNVGLARYSKAPAKTTSDVPEHHFHTLVPYMFFNDIDDPEIEHSARAFTAATRVMLAYVNLVEAETVQDKLEYYRDFKAQVQRMSKLLVVLERRLHQLHAVQHILTVARAAKADEFDIRQAIVDARTTANAVDYHLYSDAELVRWLGISDESLANMIAVDLSVINEQIDTGDLFESLNGNVGVHDALAVFGIRNALADTTATDAGAAAGFVVDARA